MENVTGHGIRNCSILLVACSSVDSLINRCCHSQEITSRGHYYTLNIIFNMVRLCGIVVSLYDCHPRAARLDSWLFCRTFSRIISSGMVFPQHLEDNLEVFDISNEIWFIKLKLRLKDYIIIITWPLVLPSTM